MKLRLTYKHALFALALIQGYPCPAQAQNTQMVVGTVDYEGIVAEPEVIAFVHQELRKLGFAHANLVKVIKEIVSKDPYGNNSGNNSADASGFTDPAHDCIVYFYARKTKDGKDAIQVPQDLYKTIMFGTEEDRNLMRAFIGHEAAHLRLKHLDQNPDHISYLPSCIHSLCDAYHSRSHELEADEGVRNDPAILYAISRYFAKKDMLARATLAKLSWFDAPDCADEYGTSSFWNLFSTHPTYAARAKRFKERADALVQT